MQLQSLEKVLDGVGKLRAASVVAWVVNAATFLSLNIPAQDQKAGIVGASVLLAVVHVVDGFVRGKHVEALPALIAQGAEQVQADVKDPRVDEIASVVNTLAGRVAAVESQPGAPTVPDIVNALVGTAARDAAVAQAVQAATPAPEAPVLPPQA